MRKLRMTDQRGEPARANLAATDMLMAIEL
jgi:hypothetical protein